MLSAFLAGTSIPLQSAVNSRLGQQLGGPLYAAFFSFLGGLLLVIAVTAASGLGLPHQGSFAGLKWYHFTGGFYGVLIVTSVVMAAPVIGIANTLVMIVAGQLLMSVVFDNFGWFGLPEIDLSPARIAGVILIIAGAGLVQMR